ncbi:MAG: hypothetical protein BGO26_19325 [Actinobacteria bacterium 69-20]|jgi:AcrR family transcriptional regulator|nr:TetR/AcrR family transcriptional regulator [Actinomycetota bacterium]OJV24702.1 MAG: hypothetical protein BGO26_19325 [Actinobacteria bacterium 69-20]
MGEPVADRVHRPYHHGNLAAALIDAGLEMAAEGGPEAVVLREVARRVGVSPTAAYRHFNGQSGLIEEVKKASLGRLAEYMRAALTPYDGDDGGGDRGGSRGGEGGHVGDGHVGGGPGGSGRGGGDHRGGGHEGNGALGRAETRSGADRVALPGVEPGSPQERAWRRLEAIGRAYFTFALSEPGLFRCFCIGLPLPETVHLPDLRPAPSESADDRLPDPAAFGVLTEVLDELVDAGVISPERRALQVDIALWSSVHGLAVLCLDGPLAQAGREMQEQMLDTVLDVIAHGLAGAR